LLDEIFNYDRYEGYSKHDAKIRVRAKRWFRKQFSKDICSTDLISLVKAIRKLIRGKIK